MIIDLHQFATSWLAKLILAVIVVSFVVTFGYGRFTQNKEVLATVGNDEILDGQFREQYQQQLDTLRRQFPDNTEAVAQQLNLRKRVMEQLIDRRLVLRAADEMGMHVSAEDVRNAVAAVPSFQVDQRFDFETYQRVLQQNRMTPETFEARMQDDMLMQKYQRSLVGGVIVSQEEINQRYRIEAEAAEVEYVTVDPAQFGKGAKPSAEAEAAYYEKNKRDYLQPEQFRVRYLVLGLAQALGDVEIHPRAAQRYYDRMAESEFTAPKKVRASQILKRLSANAPEAEVAAQRKALQPALEAARAGKDFAALAKQYSDERATNPTGDLGFFSKDEMPADIVAATFDLPPGKVSDIVRTAFGLQIFKVTGAQAEVRKSFEQVKAQIEQKLKAERAEHRLERDADRLPGRIAQEGFEAVAKSLKVPVAESEWFDGTQTGKALGATAELYGRVKGRKPNDVGVLRRNPVQGHVFFQVLAKKEASIRSLAEVRPLVAAKVAEEQRREAATAEAKAAFARLKAAGDLAAYGKGKGFALKTTSVTSSEPNLPGLGVNREFQQAALRLSAANPFAISIRGNQIHLLHLKRRYFPKPEQEQELKQKIAAQLERQWVQYFVEAELQRLRTRYKVEILRPEVLVEPTPVAATRPG